MVEMSAKIKFGIDRMLEFAVLTPTYGFNRGAFSWDDGQTDTNPDPVIGVYEYTAPPAGMSVLINTQEYAHSYARGNYGITVHNNSLNSVWGDEDAVLFRGKIDGDLPNFMLVVFSGTTEEILGSDALPSLAQLQVFPYIAGRFDIYAPGATNSSTVWFASPLPPIPPPPGPGVPAPAAVWLFGSGLLGLLGLAGKRHV